MVPSIATILQRFTGEWATLLQPDAILAVCGEIGYTGWRDRGLTPVTTVQLFLLQILHGNTACSHLPHRSGLRFSAAASCQARARLPLRVFDLLLERFSSAVQRSAVDDGRWHGHRTCFVDGSGCSMPDTPALHDAFGQPTEQRPGCGVPVARLLRLFHAGTGVLLKLVVAPLLTHDLAQVQAVHPSLQAGDVLVADRGLCSYAHLALLLQAGVHAVLRVWARQIVDVTAGRPLVRPGVRRTPAVKGIPRSRWLKTLGFHAPLVTWLKPTTVSLMAHPGGMGRPARGLGAPRSARPPRHAWVPEPPDYARHHTARCKGLLYCRPRRVVPPTLAGRDLAGAPQDHDADGCAAL
jgi:hypothetical protein